MRVIIGGDYYVDRDGNLPSISEEISAFFRAADAVILNYEGPILSEGIKEFKTGPNLQQHKDSINYVASCGVSAVTVANNHFFDYGLSGVQKTLAELKKNYVVPVGIRKNGKSRPYIVETNGVKAFFLSYAEEEWCGPQDDEEALAVFDVINVARDVKEYATQGVVILILHGNNEYNSLPSPFMQSQARFFIENGASAVAFHHSHLISGREYWQGRPIFYGLGNFQFTKSSNYPGWYDGMLVILDFEIISSEVVLKEHVVFCGFDKNDYSVRFLKGEDRLFIENEFLSLSICMTSGDAIRENYNVFLVMMENMYKDMLNPLYGKGRLLSILGRLYVHHFFLKKNRAALLLNAIKCQSHRFIMRQMLSREIKRHD